VVTDNNFRKDAYLFGESQSRVVVSVSPSQKAEFEALASKSGITLLGKVQGKNIVIDGEDYGAIARWKKGYDTELGAIMEKE
jgi:phosphoribosylformylglycinamidine synthase